MTEPAISLTVETMNVGSASDLIALLGITQGDPMVRPASKPRTVQPGNDGADLIAPPTDVPASLVLQQLAEMKQQLADIQAGRPAETAAAPQPAQPTQNASPAEPPNAGPVPHLYYLQQLRDALPSEKYNTSTLHAMNRVRFCPDCDRIRHIEGFGVPTGQRPIEILEDVPCDLCSSTTSPAACSRFNVDCLQAFYRALRNDGFAASTSKGIVKHARTVLSRMAENPAIADLVPRITRRLRYENSPVRIRLVPREQLFAVWQVCDRAEWPRFVPNAGDWWRLCLSLLITYGMRISEVCDLCWSGRSFGDLTEGVFDQELPPHDQLRANKMARSEHGWMCYRPNKQGDGKPDPLLLPITASLRPLLDTVREWNFDRLLPVSENPDSGFRQNPRSFYRQLRELKKAAGLTVGDAPWTPHDFRRTCETMLSMQFDRESAASWTGHADRSVSGQHYVDMTVVFCAMAREMDLANWTRSAAA